MNSPLYPVYGMSPNLLCSKSSKRVVNQLILVCRGAVAKLHKLSAAQTPNLYDLNSGGCESKDQARAEFVLLRLVRESLSSLLLRSLWLSGNRWLVEPRPDA